MSLPRIPDAELDDWRRVYPAGGAAAVQALYPHTRILFTSAYTENAIVHQGVLNKGVELLQKPFTPSALAHKLREVLDRPTAGPSLSPEVVRSPVVL